MLDRIAVNVLALFAVGLGSIAVSPLSAQEAPGENQAVLVQQKLSGPRFGATVFTGDVAKFRTANDKSRIMSQFGWQWETQMMSSQSGNQALMEWVLLVGGVEQDEFNVSLGWLAGYRLANGFEVGAGPNVSKTKESGDLTTSMLVATGYTMSAGGLNVPLNAAMSFAEGGPRMTFLVGWVIGR